MRFGEIINCSLDISVKISNSSRNIFFISKNRQFANYDAETSTIDTQTVICEASNTAASQLRRRNKPATLFKSIEPYSSLTLS